MAGMPQLREVGWLYAPDDRFLPLALVRLEERMDGSGRWDIYLNDPAAAERQHGEFVDEASARAELERIYEAGRVDGEWRIKIYAPGQPDPA